MSNEGYHDSVAALSDRDPGYARAIVSRWKSWKPWTGTYHAYGRLQDAESESCAQAQRDEEKETRSH